MATTDTQETLLLMLARMRATAKLLQQAEEALTGASEYIETDDVEMLVAVAGRGVDRIVSRLELATGAVEVGEGIELVTATEPAAEPVDWADFEARR